jgi:hypothetical protein
MSPGKAARELEIPSALSTQQSSLERLTAMVGQLTDRLKPIIREEPTGAPNEKPERAYQTPMARRMVDVARGIDEIADRIVWLNDHIEL